MNAKADQRDRSHAAILDSACKLLRERGIAGARVADVMEGAGLTVGGFYAHFASKEALVDDAIARTGAALRARLFGRLDDKPAEDRAEVVLKRYLSTAHRDAVRDGCPMPAILGEIATTAAAHRAAIAEQIEALAAGLGEEVPAREGASKKTIALALVALMIGGLTLSRALAGTPLSDDVIKACRALGRIALRPKP